MSKIRMREGPEPISHLFLAHGQMETDPVVCYNGAIEKKHHLLFELVMNYGGDTMARPRENRNINWFPGHMRTTFKQMRENLKLVDIVCELADARIPLSSRNPQLDKVIGDKPRLLIFNKYDLADPKENDRWMAYYKKIGQPVIQYNALTDRNTPLLYRTSAGILSDLFERRAQRGSDDRRIKMMVVGIPNVGKSTFINNIAEKRKTNVGDRPGITRTGQWIKTDQDLLLLDTPGVLWPKFDSDEIGMNLAYTLAIKDEIMDMVNMAYDFLRLMVDRYPHLIESRYEVEIQEDLYETWQAIGRRRGALMRGGVIDDTKVANLIMDDFRKGRLGRISLETVDEVDHG